MFAGYRQTVKKHGTPMHVQLAGLHPFTDGCDFCFHFFPLRGCNYQFNLCFSSLLFSSHNYHTLSVARLLWWSCWPPSTTTVDCTTAVWPDCRLATEATTAVWLDCRGGRAGHPDSIDIQNISGFPWISMDVYGYHGKCVGGWGAPGRRTLPAGPGLHDRQFGKEVFARGLL